MLALRLLPYSRPVRKRQRTYFLLLMQSGSRLNRSGCTGLAALVQVEAKETVLISVSGCAKNLGEFADKSAPNFSFSPEIIPLTLAVSIGG